MKNRWIRLLALLLIAGILAGCGASSPASDANVNENSKQKEQEEQKPAQPEAPVIESGISVSGTSVTAAGKTVDLHEKNEYVQSVESCRWLEKNKIAAQCEISGSKSQAYYFAVYDVVRDMYVYEQYGKQFIWQNDDIDTLVYVLDYAGERQPSKVCNKKDMVLYESSAEEQIVHVSFVPKGIKVELADLRGENPRQVLVEAAT